MTEHAATQCYACNGDGDRTCVGCGQRLCVVHAASGSGIARSVFGPLYDDGKTRCDACHGARFWRAILALVVIIGLAVSLVSLASSRWLGVLGGAGIAIVIGGFALWRTHAFEVRAKSRTPR